MRLPTPHENKPAEMNNTALPTELEKPPQCLALLNPIIPHPSGITLYTKLNK